MEEYRNRSVLYYNTVALCSRTRGGAIIIGVIIAILISNGVRVREEERT